MMLRIKFVDAVTSSSADIGFYYFFGDKSAAYCNAETGVLLKNIICKVS